MVTIQPLVVERSADLYAVVDRNRLHLTNLTWAATATVESVSDYIRATNASEDQLWGVYVDQQLAGCVTLRNRGDHDEIGYWLAHDRRGRGVMTEAVRQFVEQTNRPIAARTLHDNVASRKILLRNRFVETNRDEVWVYYTHSC